MSSGFRRIAHLCFINQFSKKWHELASTASGRKGAKIQYDISWFFSKHFFFQNIKIKLNSNAWMILKSSVVVFQALKLLQPQWPQQPQQPQWPQWPQQPHFIKKITDLDDLIIPSTQMTNTSPFLWNGSSKIQFFTDIWFSSWRGCWGQPMSFFWKLVDKTQMCNPPEATRHHSLIKLLILLPLKAVYFRTFQCEIPCRLC